MNEALFRFINSTIKNPFLDVFMPVLSDKDYIVIPGLVAAGLMLYFGRRHVRTTVLALVLALWLSDVGSEKVLKNLFCVPRPYVVLHDVNVHRGGGWLVYDPTWYGRDPRKSNAFPSSHAANAAAVATVLAFLSRRTLWFGVPLALLVGISRMYTGNHLPDAVLAGYGWGIAAGVIMVFFSRWVVRRLFGEPAPEPIPAAPMSKTRKVFLGLLAAWTLFNFGYLHLGLFDLAGDEAQYWDWSRHLALGYYSKPPMVAYVDAILVGAGGNKEWSLRTGAVLFMSGALALLYALTLRISRDERTALLAVLAALAMPLTWVGSVLQTIDPLLVFFWMLAMYAFHRAVNGESRWWWGVGLALGGGMLSKYTMALLPIGFALYLLLIDRRWLRTRGPYLALAVALACLSGVLYWNWTHDWVSFHHTAAIGARGGWSPKKAVAYLGGFLGGQMGVVSPILFGFFIWAMGWCFRRMRQNRDAAFLFLSFLSVFGFYTLVALTRMTQANWPACAYLAAAPALALAWRSRERGAGGRRTLTAGLVLGCVLGLLLRFSPALYWVSDVTTGPDARPDRIHLMKWSIDPRKDFTNELRGGRELGQALAKYTDKKSKTNPFIFSDRYQLTALAAFYTPGRPRAYCLPIGSRRLNQYDIWGGWEQLKGRDGLFVTGGDSRKAQQYINGMVHMAGAFERGEVLETVPVLRGKTVVKTYTISRLSHFSGHIIPKGPSRY